MESENKITMNDFFDDDDMDKALIIQNVLGGPLVLTDIGIPYPDSIHKRCNGPA